MTNGDHGTQQDGKFLEPDRKDFLDYFVRDAEPIAGLGGYSRSSVVTYLENLQGEDDVPVSKLNRTFPLEDTRWTNLYFGPEGKLSRGAPGKDGGSDVYFSGSGRQSWSYQGGHSSGAPFTTEDAHGQDELIYSPEKFKQPTAIIGPATATLHMSSTAPDTEIFVQVIDEAPDGSRYFVQRGMLKASHRAIMKGLSDRLPNGTIYRPHRPHTNPTNITPGETYEYLVEIFPFGHVFRPGHKLIVKIHAPPLVDSYYAYIPKRPVGLNTLYYGRKTPSRLMLPFVPLNGVNLKPEPKPCTLEDIRCVG
jgi:putative CocE/NonD family hydrolase